MNILILEDNPDHFELIEDMFDSINDKSESFDIEHAATLNAGIDGLTSEKFDLCLCDLKLPDSSIENTVDWLTSQSMKLPIIALTSFSSLDVARGLLKCGIQDYMEKGDLTPQLLLKTCNYAIERYHHQLSIESNNEDMQIFCASLSHDFNGLVSNVKFYSDVIRSDLSERIELTDKESMMFDNLAQNSEKIVNLTTDLQKYLSIGYIKNEYQDVDLVKLLTEVVYFIKSSSIEMFDVKIQKNIPNIQGTSVLLHILFHNLLSNSIKYCEKKPSITISSIHDEDSVKISIQDNGIGFDITEAKNIFSPFYRIKTKDKFVGSGLGLSIVKRVLEHHQSFIDVKSELGVGSCFTMTFKRHLK